MNSEELKAYEAAVDNCEVLRERLAKYEDLDGKALGVGVPEGWAIAPSEIHLSAADDDEGQKVYGLHLSCDECAEEGVTTLAEFAAPKPAAHSEDVRGALLWASQQLVLMTSADGSGHADAALAALMMAGIHECEAAQMVSKWKSRRQWAAPEESGQ